MKNVTTILLASLLLPIASWAADLRGDPEAARQAWTLIGEGALIIDVRTAEEFEAGHLEGAVHAPYDDTDALLAAIGPNRDRSVVLYCGSGRRAGLAMDALQEMGYRNLHNASGLDALEATGPESSTD